MSSDNDKPFSFGDITVDCENFRVLKAGQGLALTPRAFDVLVFLMKHAGRVVEKRELFDEVWKDTVVTDNALTKIIKEIRHALVDDANAPQYIETVPRRGYRFIGRIGVDSSIAAIPPREAEPQLTSRPRFRISQVTIISIVALVFVAALIGWLVARRNAATAPVSSVRHIAVLPFKPLDVQSRDESLEMGMADTLITRLSNLKQVVVRPIGAVRKYADLQQDPVKAGQEIQAEAVLDGTIQKSAGRIRVTARLIDVQDGKTLWSARFDEPFEDIFKVQDSIAERLANALTLQLSRPEQELLAKHYTENADAYQLYLQAQLTWHGRRRDWIKQSLENYQQALEKDPNFALAHIGVADCYIMLSGRRAISMQDAEVKARSSIMKALELDGTLAQAHNALAELKYQYEYDWVGAEKEFKNAIDLNSNIAWIRLAYGWFLMSSGRFDEATVQMEKAQELDPSSLTVRVGRGRLFYYSRQYDLALRHFQNIAAVEPDDESAYFSLFTIYDRKQMYPEALEAYLKAGQLNGAPAEQIDRLRQIFKSSGWQGFIRQQLDEFDRAKANQTGNNFRRAHLLLRLGRNDEAFAAFEKVFAEHDPAILQFKVEPLYDSLRDDPRYAKLLRQIGLQP